MMVTACRGERDSTSRKLVGETPARYLVRPRSFPSSGPGGGLPASRRSFCHVKAGILRGYRDIELNSMRRTISHQFLFPFSFRSLYSSSSNSNSSNSITTLQMRFGYILYCTVGTQGRHHVGGLPSLLL